jgi:hypothetical protein
MKKVLAVVIAVAFISIGAVVTHAQVPFVQVYFDQNLTQTQGHCEDHYLGEIGNLYVALVNFNTYVKTVEFAIDMGPNSPVLYQGDVMVPSAILWLGQSYRDGINDGPLGASPDDGITITYDLPQNAFDPFVCMMLQVAWTCETCDGPQQPISVVPHEYFNTIQAVEYQTFALIDGVGMTSLVCPGTVKTDEKSWGQIKALYNN